MNIHLNTHSYYSFVQGIPSPKALAETAARYEMPALALSDHNGLTGAIEFYDACVQVGVQPILGLELPVEQPLGKGELVLLAMDMEGWGNLCRISSILQSTPGRDPSEGLFWEKLAMHSHGLICLSGGPLGLPANLLSRNQDKDILTYLSQLDEIFGDRLYVQLYLHRERDRQLISLLQRQAEKLGLPTVASHSIYYLTPEQAPLAKTLSAMRLNQRLDELAVEDVPPAEAYFLSPEQMTYRFGDFPQALAASAEIASRCRLNLPLGIAHYPEIPLPPGKTALDVLRQRAFQGAKRRYGNLTDPIKSRLEHELNVIGDRSYAPLFLIVQEILEYARANGVPVSSRGSAASSLVAHCLDITSPDPIALNLYFERFLNPARSKPPDIDTDLCSARRGNVIQHVYQQYGAERVAMVATINRFRRRSALREVAKAYGLSPGEIKRMTDEMPSRGWGPPWRRTGVEEDPFANLGGQYHSEIHKAIFRDAAAILKNPRHLSVHPGGIVIAPGPINDLAPTHLASKGIVITQFDLDSIDRLGLVKIDLLGTRGLSVLGDLAETIYGWQKSDYANSLQVLESIPFDDSDTAQLVRSAQTIGCFQIESPGMRLTLREIKALSPEDIMIALALYRPGPLTGGLKETYVQCHLGQQPVKHIHPALETLLEDTYGVILYQEQVLRIASELAGLSLADADLLRRAMSHFDPGERMKTLKQRFIEGAQKLNGVPVATGEEIWELMAAFAGYGFPKAHAASYAEIAWRSAWCKAHYPVEFMAAVLANWGGYYSQRIYLNESRRLGIQVRPPHINHANINFRVAYPKEGGMIYMGLGQVRELTRKTQSRIIRERPFKTLEDFLTRVDPRPVEAENLIKVGALYGFGSIPELLDLVNKGGWRYRQPPLFDLSLDNGTFPDWDLSSRVAAQQAILGASLDAHPLELLDRQAVESLNPVSSSQVIEMLGETVRLLGIRQTLQRVQGQQGEPYYALELEDLDGVVAILFPANLYRRYRYVLANRTPIVVEGEAAVEPKLGEVVVYGKKTWRFSVQGK